MPYIRNKKDLQIGLERLLTDARVMGITDREMRHVLISVLHTQLYDTRINPSNCGDLSHTIKVSKRTNTQFYDNKRFASRRLGYPSLSDDAFLSMLLDMYAVKTKAESQ